MSDERNFQVSIPLDSDGFLRRACPTCEREFKWRPDDDGDDDGGSQESYFCPYCGVQARTDDWFTEAQSAQIEAMIMGEVIGPELKKLDKSLRNIGRSSGGLISASMEFDAPEPPIEETVADNDMRRVDFACHPEEPLKVIEGWSSAVYCLICGAPQAPSGGAGNPSSKA